MGTPGVYAYFKQSLPLCSGLKPLIIKLKWLLLRADLFEDVWSLAQIPVRSVRSSLPGVQASGQIFKAVVLAGRMCFTLKWMQVSNLPWVVAVRCHWKTSQGHRSIFNVFNTFSLMFTKCFPGTIPFFFTCFKSCQPYKNCKNKNSTRTHDRTFWHQSEALYP